MPYQATSVCHWVSYLCGHWWCLWMSTFYSHIFLLFEKKKNRSPSPNWFPLLFMLLLLLFLLFGFSFGFLITKLTLSIQHGCSNFHFEIHSKEKCFFFCLFFKQVNIWLDTKIKLIEFCFKNNIKTKRFSFDKKKTNWIQCSKPSSIDRFLV